MRQFNKDKPHKWGTKIFVAACAKTAYCLRIEVYCGAKTHLRTPVPKDNNTGEAAVLRNMLALCPPSPSSPWRLVVTDRFYTSVRLALELLHRRIYLTGTIQTDRAGYAKDVVTSKSYKTVNKKKEMVPPQGTIKLAQNKHFPQITAAMWMDRNPVHLLSSGGSRAMGTCTRRIAGEQQTVPAPELVLDYHRWMGGVDIHDQLRMQRTASPSRPDSYQASPARGSGGGHRLEENPDTVEGEQGVKRRQRSCKVCALFKVKPRTFTKYFCPEWSNGNKRKYLCNVAREGREKKCFSIWHNDWGNGMDIPRLLLEDHKLRNRPHLSHPGKKRRRRDSAGGGSAGEGDARSCEGGDEDEANEDEE
ncbi:hypothetical protein ON010_g12347 [Phytophthora cinnamomi]|nr:hypothetical protein ON010_g12347 [Phytophthora cinnamomi]